MLGTAQAAASIAGAGVAGALGQQVSSVTLLTGQGPDARPDSIAIVVKAAVSRPLAMRSAS